MEVSSRSALRCGERIGLVCVWLSCGLIAQFEVDVSIAALMLMCRAGSIEEMNGAIAGTVRHLRSLVL